MRRSPLFAVMLPAFGAALLRSRRRIRCNRRHPASACDGSFLTRRWREMDSNFRFRARDKASVPRFRLAAFGDLHRRQPQIIERWRLAAEAGDYRLRPPLHGTRNRKFESIPLQRRVMQTFGPWRVARSRTRPGPAFRAQRESIGGEVLVSDRAAIGRGQPAAARAAGVANRVQAAEDCARPIMFYSRCGICW